MHNIHNYGDEPPPSVDLQLRLKQKDMNIFASKERLLVWQNVCLFWDFEDVYTHSRDCKGRIMHTSTQQEELKEE